MVLLNIVLLLVVYATAITGTVVMKKIQPGNKWYPWWAVFICVLFTVYILKVLNLV